MPIVVTNEFALIRPRLLRQVKTLIGRGSLPLPGGDPLLKIGFALDLKKVLQDGWVSITASRPDGIQVLLLSGNMVVAVLDFFHVAGRLKFSHAITGAALKEYIDALNALEEKHRTATQRCQVANLPFIPGKGYYFMVRKGRSPAFFQYENGSLKELSKIALEAHLQEIIDSRKSLTPTR